MNQTLTNATWLLAACTFLLAVVAAWQAWLSRVALRQQLEITKSDFRFESVRQTLAAAPMIVMEASADVHQKAGLTVVSSHGRIRLINRGSGPAVKIRFSGLFNGQTITAAQMAVPPLGQNGQFGTSISVEPDGDRAFHGDEIIIRYEDTFGNLYVSEYAHFWRSGGWLTWKRPWVGSEFGLQKPEDCSNDAALWGATGREGFELNGKWQT